IFDFPRHNATRNTKLLGRNYCKILHRIQDRWKNYNIVSRDVLRNYFTSILQIGFFKRGLELEPTLSPS
uniref:Uncharacterized protein n=1 Tax=Athene cunicularia TaxID=194338 RepID=A0A663N1C1_ATHCN